MKKRDIVTMAAVVLTVWSCNPTDDGLRQENRVPIQLSAAVDGVAQAASRTRTGETSSTTQDRELLEGQTVDAYIKVKGGDWLTGLSATKPRHFEVKGSGNIDRTDGESMDYYPMDATPVEVYAVHPSYASGTDFTVCRDQRLESDYAASDLCYSKTAKVERSASRQPLTFKHVLSKIIVNVNTGVGGTVSNLRLRAKTKTTLTYPADNDDGYTLGTASEVGSIQMTPGAAAIIPPQTTAAEGDVRITFDLSGVGPIVYDFPAGTAFASNTQYTYTVQVGASVTVTSSVANWGKDADGSTLNDDVTKNKTVEIGRPKLPIEYVVGTHNLQTATTMAEDDNVSHSAYFCWNTTNSTTPKANIQKMINGTALAGGYHLPSKAEWCSVLAPYYAQTTSQTDAAMGGETAVRIVYKRGSSNNLSETVAWGVTNNNTSSTYSANNYVYDVNRVFYNDYNCPNDDDHTYIGYGLRFKEMIGVNYVNGRYTCAYRYEYKSSDSSVGGASLTVQVKYVGSNQNITIFTISDDTWWSSPDFTIILPACGHGSSTVSADQSAGWASAQDMDCGYYWSATVRDASYLHTTFFNGSYVLGNNWSGPGEVRSVRLFKDAE